jgi:hypothetical protein
MNIHPQRKEIIIMTTTINAARQAGRPYSVLLLYPDYLDDTGYQTFFAHVEGRDAAEAVRAARRKAVCAQSEPVEDPTDFHPLLVIEGHHASEPLFNH